MDHTHQKMSFLLNTYLTFYGHVTSTFYLKYVSLFSIDFPYKLRISAPIAGSLTIEMRRIPTFRFTCIRWISIDVGSFSCIGMQVERNVRTFEVWTFAWKSLYGMRRSECMFKTYQDTIHGSGKTQLFSLFFYS